MMLELHKIKNLIEKQTSGQFKKIKNVRSNRTLNIPLLYLDLFHRIIIETFAVLTIHHSLTIYDLMHLLNLN